MIKVNRPPEIQLPKALADIANASLEDLEATNG